MPKIFLNDAVPELSLEELTVEDLTILMGWATALLSWDDPVVALHFDGPTSTDGDSSEDDVLHNLMIIYIDRIQLDINAVSSFSNLALAVLLLRMLVELVWNLLI